MSHLIISQDGNHMTCQCGSCSVSMHVWNVMSEHTQLAVKHLANNCLVCRDLEKDKRAKVKLFSVDVALYATAYVQATNPDEAKQLLNESFISTSLEVPEDGSLIIGDRYEDIMSNRSLVITLSPAMTIDHMLHEPEQVWPEE